MTDVLSNLGNGPRQSAAQASLNLINQDTNPSQAETAAAAFSDDLDNFLLLLTTQLQNQDPTEPLDTNEFTNQLVAFTGVEQQIATNRNLESLIEAQTGTALSSAVGFVGQEIEAEGNAGLLQNGLAAFSYELASNADEVEVIISNSGGRAVYQGPAPSDAGVNRVFWDGTNSFNGNIEEPGTYYITVAAVNERGTEIEATTRTTGVATGAELVNGQVILEVAGLDVPLNDVLSIRARQQFVPAGTNTASAPEEDTSLVEDIVDGVIETVDEII